MNEIEPRQSNGPVCPDCGSDDLAARLEDDVAVYGQGEEAVSLPVRVTVRTCRSCDMEFMGHEVQDIYHEAICRHLGVGMAEENE